MEYELSFFNFNYKEIKQKLEQLGGKRIHKFKLFRVTYFKLVDGSKGFVRVRDEAGEVTLTAKRKNADSKYPEEYEIKLNASYDDTVKLLKASGLALYNIAEKYREKWEIPGCHEVIFDIWPCLPIAMEVDCHDEKSLHSLIEKLGLKLSDSFTNNKYEYLYDIPEKQMESFPIVTFANCGKTIDSHVTKHREIFKMVIDKDANEIGKMKFKY